MAEALIVACPHCNTLNRAPRDKLAPGNSGKCGHCGSPLFTGHPVALNAASFETHAVKSDIPLLVDFLASWCPPCRAMNPILDRLAQQFKVCKVNVMTNQPLARRYGVSGIPVLMVFKDGQIVARHDGATPEATLRAEMERFSRP